MLNDKELVKYADVLLWGLRVAKKGILKKNEIILLQYELPALKLAEVLYGKILDMGMHPIQRMGLTFGMEYNFYKKANEKQLTFWPPGEKELYKNVNGRILLRAPESLTHLKDIDPMKIGKVLVSRKPLRDILDKREAKRLYSWTLCTLPTSEPARQAKMTLREYTDQIIKGCYLDKDDPVSAWANIHKNVIDIKKWLNSLKVRSFHIESENIDLTIIPGEKRKWAGVSGHNIPSFEVFPCSRLYLHGITFCEGNADPFHVVAASERGQIGKISPFCPPPIRRKKDFTKKQLSMDQGARRVGEFSLTDKRFSKIDRFMADTLFDENFGGKEGNCHVALGSSYTDTYNGDPAEMTAARKKKLGFNDSALHWDLVNTERKTVTAHLTNGKKKVIYENGIFTY